MSCKSQYNNIVNTVIAHENGFISTKVFQTEVTSSKMQNLRNYRSELMQYEPAREVTHCRMLKSCSGNSATGVWKKRKKTQNSVISWNSILRINFCCDSLRNRDSFIPCINIQGPYHEKMKISDLIEVKHFELQCLLYCGNSNLGGKVILNVQHHNGCRLPDEEWRFKNKLFCLADNVFTGIFAVGAQNGFYLFNRRDLYSIYSFDDNITSLAFNHDGKVLFIGRANHSVTAVDFRCTKNRHNHPEICKNLGHKNTKEIKVLSDQISLIVSGEKISKVDLRMGRVLFEYLGHVDTFENRRSISFDENMDVLCATGKDNHTRIWSLNTGRLMKTIAPYLEVIEPVHSCFQTVPGGICITIIEDGLFSVYYSL